MAKYYMDNDALQNFAQKIGESFLYLGKEAESDKDFSQTVFFKTIFNKGIKIGDFILKEENGIFSIEIE